MKFTDVRTWRIRIHGKVEEEDIRPTSPVWFSIEQAEPAGTWLSLEADQSGIVGLIRHLHALGLVLISMSCSVEGSMDDGSDSNEADPHEERKEHETRN